MNENEAEDEHTDGVNGDDDNMEQSDVDDDNTEKTDGDDDTMEESDVDNDDKDEHFNENAKNDNAVTDSNEQQTSGVDNDRDDDSTPSYDTVVGGSGEINNVDMEDSFSLNEIFGTPVCDEVITTEGAKENIELYVCSGDGSESSVEILDTNSGGDVMNDEGKFISAKEARKLNKERAKAG
ncbi:prostatic spermine-binding protein-like [Mytilus californianus]|uniref:prostatic spermine-binding protein-like n=1 Tax=Mytilus californianus TaxID=6549 RepID=UPI0022485BE6|nr:prostatic spermine-binding protein-like [Mytilus californianus]